MKHFKILLVDDDISYCQSFITNASQIGLKTDSDIEVVATHNWEEASELLSAPGFDGVVLDAKCLITKDQDTEDFEFLAVALRGIETIERSQNRRIPFAVNTGYIGEKEAQTMNKLIDQMHGRRFSKTEPKESLIEYLLQEIESSPEGWVLKKYSDVFEVYNLNLLGRGSKSDLISLILESDNPAANATSLARIRVLQEELYNALDQKGIFAVGFAPRNSPPSFSDRNKFLSGNEDKYYRPTTPVYQTSVIRHIGHTIHRVSSDFGNHVPKKPQNVTIRYWEHPSNYAVKSLLFGLLEQYLWFKSLVR